MGRLLAASDVKSIGAQAQADLSLLAPGAIQGREQLIDGGRRHARLSLL